MRDVLRPNVLRQVAVWLLLGALIEAGPLCSAAGVPTLPATPRELHASQCVAALDASAESIARQVRSGRKEMRPVLLGTLRAGTAFVGDAYLQGGAEEKRAKGLTREARKRQASLPANELAVRQAACSEEGGRLFLAANGLERAVVSRFADQRMEKLVGK